MQQSARESVAEMGKKREKEKAPEVLTMNDHPDARYMNLRKQLYNWLKAVLAWGPIPPNSGTNAQHALAKLQT